LTSLITDAETIVAKTDSGLEIMQKLALQGEIDAISRALIAKVNALIQASL
jgi:hypothetical protein